MPVKYEKLERFDLICVTKLGWLSVVGKLHMFSRDKVHNIHIFLHPTGALRVLKEYCFASRLRSFNFSQLTKCRNPWK